METRLKRLRSLGGVRRYRRGCVVRHDARSAHRFSVGTWKLNLAKSKSSPGPAAKSATTKIEAAGAGTKVIVDQAPADGSTRHWEFTANYDGKDVPVIGNNPDADMIARARIDANTVKTISKKNGKVTTTQT